MRREFYKTVPSCCFNLVLYVIKFRPATELDSKSILSDWNKGFAPINRSIYFARVTTPFILNMYVYKHDDPAKRISK